MSLTPELVLRAYAAGIFPMAEARGDPEVFWVDPERRGILPLEGFHISRSLSRRMKKGGYRVAINEDFPAVMEACADREETWINAEILSVYTALHAAGFAHSFEVRGAGGLIGGTYGLALGTAFFGESMFSAARDGSKIALAHLTDHLRRTGFTLFDTQFLTPHLASLGGIEISRAEYHEKLSEALTVQADILSQPPEQDPSQVLQRVTQTS
ncbi:leucyl/phenylalanyl-tRNA--protein transferase [Rhodobacteraceae bacterium 63075]|nr:leucyl/phenylalanyl-tRNA--protein transferase [Rhodobacteraceae bacterium 63075]